jgi:hypothetical protein
VATTLVNEIEIARSPADVYAYVTQPWRWHEWHPSSRSARADVEVLRVGDAFDEVIEVQPFSPLPPRLRRSTRYRVTKAEPGIVWEVQGDTGDASLTIHYDLAAIGSGTRFTRTLTFATRGLSRIYMPFLRARMARLSEVALGNLKRTLEQR